jgi:hypothetical protein
VCSGRFLPSCGCRGKQYQGLSVKSSQPERAGPENIQFSAHNRVIYGKLVGK